MFENWWKFFAYLRSFYRLTELQVFSLPEGNVFCLRKSKILQSLSTQKYSLHTYFVGGNPEPGYSLSRWECFHFINDLNTEESQTPSSSSGESRPPPMWFSRASRLHKKIDELLNLELVYLTPEFDIQSSNYNNYCCGTQSIQITWGLEGAQMKQIYRKEAGSDEKLESVRNYPNSKVLTSGSFGTSWK